MFPATVEVRVVVQLSTLVPDLVAVLLDLLIHAADSILNLVLLEVVFQDNRGFAPDVSSSLPVLDHGL